MSSLTSSHNAPGSVTGLSCDIIDIAGSRCTKKYRTYAYITSSEPLARNIFVGRDAGFVNLFRILEVIKYNSLETAVDIHYAQLSEFSDRATCLRSMSRVHPTDAAVWVVKYTMD